MVLTNLTAYDVLTKLRQQDFFQVIAFFCTRKNCRQSTKEKSSLTQLNEKLFIQIVGAAKLANQSQYMT